MAHRGTPHLFSGMFLVVTTLTGVTFGQTGFVNWETPHVSPIGLTPNGQRLLAVNTADNRLEVFDVSGGSPVAVASIPVGLDPVSVRARNDNEVWVINHVSDSISIVDLATGRVRGTIGTGDEPTDVVFAAGKAFVSVSQLNQVRVWDLANLGSVPTIVNIPGEDPRAMAVSPDGTKVYVAIFESGNPTTAVRQQDVTNPGGPYGGLNPPPNSGNVFNPPMTAGLPPPPPVAQIVRRNAAGQWMDDNGRNWSQFVTWNLADHDVAIIDTGSLALTFANGMLSTVMGIGVKPDGTVTVVGTECANELRFEPNVQSIFVRVEMGSFNPATPGTTAVVELNPHLNYTVRTVSQGLRDLSVGDPRAIVWHPTNGRAYIAGMGSNTVVVSDDSGARFAQVEVGQGPTGLAISGDGSRLYVMNKFDGSISVVDTTTNSEMSRTPFFDPTPTPIKVGRPLLYNTHTTSGLGQVACASCHIDGRTDHTAWDLGNPAGQMKAFNQTCRQPTCNPWHPMKGPMVTQTLQGIVGVEPFHWRGDREDLAAFAPAFVGLQGADAEPTTPQMQDFTNFVATIRFPPNPNRNLDNTLPTAVPSSLGGTGNAVTGLNLYNTLPTVGGAPCAACHGPANGSGSNRTIDNPPLPLAPQPLKMAQLRNMHEKTGWNRASQQSNRGFGFNHHSDADTLTNLLTLGFTFAPGAQGQQQRRDVEALLLSFSVQTHAAVGAQVTFDGGNNNDATSIARLNLFTTLANGGQVGLVAHGRVGGVDRGYSYTGAGNMQSDQAGQTTTVTALRTNAAVGNEITFTVVPNGTQVRIGIDRDADGFFDRDELDGCGDPANATIHPVATGDVNVDGLRDAGDAPALAAVLLDPGSATAQQRCAADLNRDGSADGSDIGPFVACILGGSCP